MRGAVSPDHIHMQLPAPAHMAPSKLVQYLMGRSSRRLQEEFPEFAKAVLGAAPVGTRILLPDGGRGNDQGLY